MNGKHILLILLAILSFALVYIFVPATLEPGSFSSLEGIMLSNISGQQFRLAGQFTEKPILLVFWSVTCGSCIDEIPFITDLYNKYREKMTIIGVHPTGFPLNKIQKFIKKYKKTIPYTLAIDVQGTLIKNYNISVLPKLILVSKQGKILYEHLGYTYENDGEVENAILSKL